MINVGRDPANDIFINRPTVSALHAQIIREGNSFVFIHPHPARGKTLNGIIYQGHSIAGTVPFRKTLTRGDMFRISDEHGTLVTLTYNDGTGATQESIPEIHPIPLGAPVITIGRAPDNNVVLNHPQVSGHHARLEQVQNGYRILDLNSTNHVYVNAQRVTPIYRRERTVNLGIVPYMFSKITVLGILCLLQSLMLVLFVNIKTPFLYSIMLPPFVEIYITMALTSLAGLMIGLAISAIVPNSDRSMSIVPIVLIPQVIFSGVLFSLDSPQFLQVLGAFFPARWAMAAMGSSVGLHGDKLGADAFSYWGTLVGSYSHTDAILHLLLCWAVLIVTIVVLVLATAYLLKRKDART